jgi:hypothetical protein
MVMWRSLPPCSISALTRFGSCFVHSAICMHSVQMTALSLIISLLLIQDGLPGFQIDSVLQVSRQKFCV